MTRRTSLTMVAMPCLVRLIAATCLLALVEGFVLTMSASPTNMVSRRGLLKRCSLVIPAAAVTFGMLPSQPQPAFAGVGEGDLPQEARAFRNVVSAKADWAALGKTISNRGNELSAEEWKNVALFLRRIYQVANDDMRSMAGGFSGDSKKASSQIIDSLMKQVKKTDAVVAAKNVEGFLADQAVVAKLLEDYTDLFNDVPDEL